MWGLGVILVGEWGQIVERVGHWGGGTGTPRRKGTTSLYSAWMLFVGGGASLDREMKLIKWGYVILVGGWEGPHGAKVRLLQSTDIMLRWEPRSGREALLLAHRYEGKPTCCLVGRFSHGGYKVEARVALTWTASSAALIWTWLRLWLLNQSSHQWNCRG